MVSQTSALAHTAAIILELSDAAEPATQGTGFVSCVFMDSAKTYARRLPELRDVSRGICLSTRVINLLVS